MIPHSLPGCRCRPSKNNKRSRSPTFESHSSSLRRSVFIPGSLPRRDGSEPTGFSRHFELGCYLRLALQESFTVRSAAGLYAGQRHASLVTRANDCDRFGLHARCCGFPMAALNFDSVETNFPRSRKLSLSSTNGHASSGSPKHSTRQLQRGLTNSVLESV